MAVPMRNGDGHWRSGEKCCSATQIESNPNSSASTACSSISWCAAGSDWPSISSKVEAPKPNRIDPPKPPRAATQGRPYNSFTPNSSKDQVNASHNLRQSRRLGNREPLKAAIVDISGATQGGQDGQTRSHPRW